MRLLPFLLIIILFQSSLSGCALFNKKTKDSGTQAPWWNSPNNNPDKTPVNGNGNDPLTGGLQPNEIGGVLAGSVIDKYNQVPPNTYIRWTNLDEGKSGDAPIDVAVNKEGHFTIQGLSPGAKYKLVARSKNGEKVMAGVAYATAPNIKLLILLKDDFVTPNTPDVPPPPSTPFDSKGNAEEEKSDGLEQTKNDRGFGIGRPDTLPNNKTPANNQPGWQGQNPNPSYPPNIAQGENEFERSPLVTIPPVDEKKQNFNGPEENLEGKVPTIPAPKNSVSNGAATPVPSAVVVGKQVINFALPHVDGTPWEWQKDRRGKLVLLDFWSTTCLPCRDAIPHLRILQDKYGKNGLEVIGITNESGGTLDDQRLRIARTCQTARTNYRILMASGPSNPVMHQFGIRYFPTLILVDEQGNKLWEHEGRMTRNDLDSLEQRIRVNLGM